MRLSVIYDIQEDFFKLKLEYKTKFIMKDPNHVHYRDTNIENINNICVNSLEIENLSSLTVQVILCLRRYLVKDISILIAKIYHENNIVI